MTNYTSYKYIWPPRPENKISSSSLQKFDDQNLFLAQPKLNGSSMQVYTDGSSLHTMTRHKTVISHKMNEQELKNLHRGNGWIVLCGEYMNKNNTDENKKSWNHKFVIFDILVYEGQHLLKSTFAERQELLKKLYPDNPVKLYLHQILENCFRVHSITSGFLKSYDHMIPYQMYEGLVLKQINGKLEAGLSEQNNVRTQLKCRKQTKNYAF